MIQTMKFVVMNEVNSMADNELFGNSEQLETHDKCTETRACDLISRRSAIEAGLKLVGARRRWVSDAGRMEISGIDAYMCEIHNLPSAQQEIVACGDCTHWICHDRRCGYWNHGVKPLDWCCHAERRTDG